MFRNRAGTRLAIVATAAMLIAASGGHASPAHAFGGHEQRGYGRADSGWRPLPPAVHGFWGQRRWQRYNEDFGVRAPPRSHRGYDHGWR